MDVKELIQIKLHAISTSKNLYRIHEYRVRRPAFKYFLSPREAPVGEGGGLKVTCAVSIGLDLC